MCTKNVEFSSWGAHETALVRKNTPVPWQTKPHQKLMEHKMCLTYNLYCDQTTPWQGVYFFTNTAVYRENDTLYMCHSNFIVLLPQISQALDSKLNSSVHCICSI